MIDFDSWSAQCIERGRFRDSAHVAESEKQMSTKVEIERDPFVRVVSMTKESACDFFGVPRTTRVEDAGPADGARWKPGARHFHVYIGQVSS